VIQYLKENIQFFILLLIWLVVGRYAGPVYYALIPVSIILLKNNESYLELFLGFWFILILSDNLTYSWIFAKKIKDIYFLLIAILFFLDIKNFQSSSELFKRFIPFFVITVITLAYSETLVVSAQKTLSYVLFFLVIPTYIVKIYQKDGELFFRKIVFFILTILLVCLILRFVDAGNAVSHGGRLRGLFGNPNGLGLFCMLTFLLSYLIIHLRPNLFSKNEKRLIYFLILLPLFMSGSRNVATALMLFLVLGAFYKMSPFLGFIIFLTFIVLYEMIDTNYIYIIKTLGLESFFRLGTIEVGGGRYIAWKFAWEQIQHNFFLGKGIAFDEYIMRKNYGLLSRLGHQGGVHNSYLIFWLNTGIIGVLAYFGAFVITFIKGAKNSVLSFPIMFSVMFTINFEPWIAASLNPLTIILMLIIAVLTDDIFHKEKVVLNEEKI